MPSLVVFIGHTLHINGLKPSSKLVPGTELGTVTSQDRLNYMFISFIDENYFSATLSQFIKIIITSSLYITNVTFTISFPTHKNDK